MRERFLHNVDEIGCLPVMNGYPLWYVSKYLQTPNQTSQGARGYWLMREISEKWARCLVVTSDPSLDWSKEDSDFVFSRDQQLQVCKVRTPSFQGSRSWRRVLSWLVFEFRVRRLAKNTNDPPSVVVVSSLSLLTVLTGIWLKRKYGCALVFEVRDIWPMTLTESGKFRGWHPGIRFLSWVEQQGYRQADCIVGTMPNLAEHVSNVLGYPRQVVCVPMGFKGSDPPEVDALFREAESEIPVGKFIVAYAGSVGVDNALDTYFQCAESMIGYASVHFLVIGEGDLLNMYKRKYGNLSNLTFVPAIPAAHIQRLLSRCDLLYFSTLKTKTWRYGQSLNKLVDYMLAGKPVLGSYSGYPSMINEASSGSFVEAENPAALRDEILRYVSMDLQTRETMGRRGREWLLANRDYSQLADDYWQVLRPLFDGQR